ncbi:hypothetical protein [Geobacter pickeringii]|uniref:Uncharacterized protein n=1 Tax=Geobacter pickeringii TaxID=345632 RepID=A0A0B5BA28_9BACT|nr:hypothetical protein [Geobacter pickeringii]AJE03437.1 hypothetical protein GPICK_08795 [Geobacter pickeringii]
MMEWRRYLEKDRQATAWSAAEGSFDASCATAEIERLVKEVSAFRVPGGWDEVKTRQAEEWRQLQAAMAAMDTAFTRRDVVGVSEAIAEARRVLQWIRRA